VERSLPVVPVAKLSDLLDYLRDSPDLARNLSAVEEYRRRYGILS
jgi:orotate phosphoribosyltransferase